MRFLHRVRRLRRWPRALLVGLVLAFSLNAIAHAAHRHDPATTASALHSVTCSYCVTFGSLATATSHPSPDQPVHNDRFDVVVAAAAPESPRQHSPAQPRAPPPLLKAHLAVVR